MARAGGGASDPEGTSVSFLCLELILTAWAFLRQLVADLGASLSCLFPCSASGFLVFPSALKNIRGL